MTIKEIYEKYKHLDKLICSRDFQDEYTDCFKSSVLKDLWQAVKQAVGKEE